MQRGSEILYQIKVENAQNICLFTLAVRRVQHPFQSLIYKRKLICFYHPIPNQEGSLAEKLN